MKKLSVFISYRRNDTAAATGRLRDSLASILGADSVFLDFDDIPVGKDYKEVIRQRIESADIVLVVIGERYMAGANRLQQADDPVRMELETALGMHKRLIPVLVDKAEMPKPVAWPGQLRIIPDLNAYEIRNSKWAQDVRDFVKKVFDIQVFDDFTDRENALKQQNRTYTYCRKCKYPIPYSDYNRGAWILLFVCFSLVVYFAVELSQFYQFSPILIIIIGLVALVFLFFAFNRNEAFLKPVKCENCGTINKQAGKL